MRLYQIKRRLNLSCIYSAIISLNPLYAMNPNILPKTFRIISSISKLPTLKKICSISTGTSTAIETKVTFIKLVLPLRKNEIKKPIGTKTAMLPKMLTNMVQVL